MKETLTASRKTKKSTSTAKSRKSHWKNLTRDSRGRWVKRQSSDSAVSAKSTKKPVSKRSQKAARQKSTPEKAPPKEAAQASQILDKFQQDFTKICPRCSGDLKFFKIRCGPQKLVSVRKCIVCNFWIPISDK